MFKNLVNKAKNLYRKTIDAVIAFGRRVVRAVVSYCILAFYILAMALGFIAPAHADVPAGVTTAITAAATDVATVGGAVILVHIGIKVWRWIRSAF